MAKRAASIAVLLAAVFVATGAAAQEVTLKFSHYKVLALFVHNPGLIHTKGKKILEPADMKGVRFRSPTTPCRRR